MAGLERVHGLVGAGLVLIQRPHQGGEVRIRKKRGRSAGEEARKAMAQDLVAWRGPMSQLQLAERLKVDRQRLAAWENGRSMIPAAELLELAYHVGKERKTALMRWLWHNVPADFRHHLNDIDAKESPNILVTMATLNSDVENIAFNRVRSPEQFLEAVARQVSAVSDHTLRQWEERIARVDADGSSMLQGWSVLQPTLVWEEESFSRSVRSIVGQSVRSRTPFVLRYILPYQDAVLEAWSRFDSGLRATLPSALTESAIRSLMPRPRWIPAEGYLALTASLRYHSGFCLYHLNSLGTGTLTGGKTVGIEYGPKGSLSYLMPPDEAVRIAKAFDSAFGTKAKELDELAGSDAMRSRR